MTKAEIRAQIAGRRPDFQTLETDCVGAQRFAAQGQHVFQSLEEISAAVLEKFQTLELFHNAKAIGAYMPLSDEVNVRPLLDCGSAGGVALPENPEQTGRANSPSEPSIQFYIPAFDEAIGSYRMAKYTPELKTGKFGIPEPAEPVWAGPDELDLILVPGVAFDRHGNRLGRGGGFYDRLLPLYNTVRVGICFNFQCLEPYCTGAHNSLKGPERIPTEPHDCRMDFLVTESEILKFAMNS